MPADRVAALWAAKERSRWDTFPVERKVLAIARTFTSTVRLLEVLSLFRGDLRVQVLFTFDDSSAFRGGVDALLRKAGIPFVPWSQVGDLEYDLALTASENVEFEQVDAPILVLPHGIGFHKYVPDSAGDGERVSGVVPDHHLLNKRIWMVTSHHAHQEHLRAAHPAAAARCVITGDPAFDRISRSIDLREDYRAMLGLREGQRLIVLTSTWRTESLLGSWPELPARLLSDLPADEYRVALVTHPNIISRHGEHHLEQGLADCCAAGLLRIPPDEGWQAALIAADLVVGDHGSVTLYAAAINRPVLLAASTTETVPGTLPAEFAATTPRLHPEPPLHAQVERAITAHPPERGETLANRLFERRGEAADTLRSLLYERLDLPLPGPPAPLRAVPNPSPKVDEPLSFVVYSWLPAPGEVHVRRSPAYVPDPGPPVAESVRHLEVADDEPDRRLPENASVIVRRRPTGIRAATAWVTDALGRWPGLRLATAALADGCLAQVADGTRIRVTAEPGERFDAALAAAAIYTCLRLGTLAGGALRLRAGPYETSFIFAVDPPR